MEQGKTGTIKMPNNFDIDSDKTFDAKLNGSKSMAKLVTAYGQYAIKTSKIYFAGPWFDERAEKLYDTCKNIYTICKKCSQYDIYYPRDEVNETPLDAFDKNIKHLKECDVVVAMVSRKDVGTAWEIGMAYALGKKIILLGYDDSTFLSHTNVMLAFTGECININEYSSMLCGNYYEKVKINNTWEGIE